MTDQNALVSVIMPTYNRPDFLRVAIQSALQQSYRNIEIIVSDNCSPENPQALIDSFCDSRIRFWRNETNLGLFGNAMKAVSLARGKYLSFLHDDDEWDARFLENLVPALEQYPEATIAFCDQFITDESGDINVQVTRKTTKNYRRDRLQSGLYQPFIEIGLVYKSIPSVAGAVIRRESIDWASISPGVGRMYDLYITYLCCKDGQAAYYLADKLVYHREHSNADTFLSGRRNGPAKISKAKVEIFCYQRFVQDHNLRPFRFHFKKLLLHAQTTLGIGLLLANRPSEARLHLFQSFRGRFFSLRTLVALLLSLVCSLVLIERSH
ncbi:glycosyltransferase family 2 protein [Leptolyngbya sp. O-77]|uniref:glycosyltransferase family 2 protein n=1 Tax=Leptolyngbya sp. O-77 TaxID=1080068 RepID=UPI00074D47A2|nr:glycosyltransferase family 2 protein [Leptolyngbya sp. O-77]BAU41761.1 UDP-Glc:alpha-D-GlcNAc-diphosphoundecaprenol beta-1,3-glucosyltransferase WfgD [Leptolyngbya sp. O-77]